MQQATSTAITLVGVLVSVAVTVAFGIKAVWWVRLLAGVGTLLALAAIVKLGTSSGRGPLARFADWVIGVESRDE